MHQAAQAANGSASWGDTSVEPQSAHLRIRWQRSGQEQLADFSAEVKTPNIHIRSPCHDLYDCNLHKWHVQCSTKPRPLTTYATSCIQGSSRVSWPSVSVYTPVPLKPRGSSYLHGSVQGFHLLGDIAVEGLGQLFWLPCPRLQHLAACHARSLAASCYSLMDLANHQKVGQMLSLSPP